MMGRLVVVAAIVLVLLTFGLLPSGTPPSDAAQDATPAASGAETYATVIALLRGPSAAATTAAAVLAPSPSPESVTMPTGVADPTVVAIIRENHPELGPEAAAEVAVGIAEVLAAPTGPEVAATLEAQLAQTPTPAPQACDETAVVPRTEEQIAAFMNEADAATPGSEGTERRIFTAVPLGEPVPAETAMAVTDTLRAEAACLNARKPLHAFAYSTDGRLRGEPEWLSAPDRITSIVVVTVANASALSDGRVGALCVFEVQPGGPSAEYCYFIWNGVRWLIDETTPLGIPAEE